MHNLLAGWRVLVVEDEMMILMMLEMALEDFGCESIVVASTLDTAMEMVSRPGFDIAMLDMNLGGNDSYPIADALDARNVPYVFCTGNNGGTGERVCRCARPFESLLGSTKWLRRSHCLSLKSKIRVPPPQHRQGTRPSAFRYKAQCTKGYGGSRHCKRPQIHVLTAIRALLPSMLQPSDYHRGVPAADCVIFRAEFPFRSISSAMNSATTSLSSLIQALPSLPVL